MRKEGGDREARGRREAGADLIVAVAPGVRKRNGHVCAQQRALQHLKRCPPHDRVALCATWT